MTRLFVAVLPAGPAVEALRRLPSFDATGVRPVPEDQWHVTLRFIGDADPETAIDLLARAQLPAAQAVLGPAVERLGPRQVVVPVAGVDDLSLAVRAATAPVGRHDARPFRGHLTLARTKPGVISPIDGVAVEAAWTVGEVALIASELRPTGAVYTTVATFPAGGAITIRRD